MLDLEKLELAELVNELRARGATRPRDDSGGYVEVGIYGKPREDLEQHPSSEIVAVVRKRQKAIYLVDSRQDLSEVTDAEVLKLASSVAVLVRESQVSSVADQIVTVQSSVFGSLYSLCPGERFWHQECIGFGSGVLVSSDMIATAGHCVSEADSQVDRIRFIFGFRSESSNQPAPTRFAVSQVYRGKELVGYKETEDESDWALVRLDRPVQDVPIANLRRSKSLSVGTSVAILGHPCGLPAKYASGAVVKDSSSPAYFTANLDAFGGNSGSPVFSKAKDGTCLVEGLLVRGSQDWVPVNDKNCVAALVIPLGANGKSAPNGEDCTRVGEFISLIPSHGEAVAR